MVSNMEKVNIFWQMAIENLEFGKMDNDNHGSLIIRVILQQTKQVIKLVVINNIAKASYNHETSTF